MAWTAPGTATLNGQLTAAFWNLQVRDNLAQTAPGKATAAGGYFVSTAANAIAERHIASSSTNSTGSTASASYVNLASFGPSVSITTGTVAIVWWEAEAFSNTLDAYSACSVEVSVTSTGAVTVAAADAHGIEWDGYGVAATNQQNVRTVCHRFTGLTAGMNTFTMKYRASGGTSSFDNRRIVVMPL